MFFSYQCRFKGSVTVPSSTLVDTTTDQTVSLQDAPSVSGNVVTQIVRGSALTANHVYQLIVTYTAAANTVLTTVTVINVPI